MDFILAHSFRGIKLHPDFQKFNMDDPAVNPLYDMIQENHLPILMHMGDPHQTYSHPKKTGYCIETISKITCYRCSSWWLGTLGRSNNLSKARSAIAV